MLLNADVFKARRSAFRPLLPLDDGPEDLSRRRAFLSRLDEAIRSEYLPRAARALCNGKTLAFQAKDAGSIPAARSKNPFPTNGRQNQPEPSGIKLILLNYLSFYL